MTAVGRLPALRHDAGLIPMGEGRQASGTRSGARGTTMHDLRALTAT
jgi:hypothetical protein